MSIKEVPTILIAYPSAFLCYGKFERKLSNILSNFNQFYIAYMADDNNIINKYLSSDKRVNNAITFSIDEEHFSSISHAIIFNDGETFNHLIDSVKNQGIKSRLIVDDITKVVNIDKDDKYEVFIGRSSHWGNPHAIDVGASLGEKSNSRAQAIEKYKYDFERPFRQQSNEDALE